MLFVVDVLGAEEIRGLVGRGLGGGKAALKVGRRFLTPPAAADRNLPARFLMPGDAVPEMTVLSLGTGLSMIVILGLVKTPDEVGAAVWV